MKGPAEKICEACGAAFQCGGYQCWCGKVGITERQMDWIAVRFKDCLCPRCLDKVSAGDQTLSPVAPVQPPAG
ncbi:MAG: cysteine-rich CWC family protein [Nitrospiraceae bacterium]|jgi:hypothetical protein|nr:cysteine-rich CWC family protein [Nitrospiraceae bacterium]